MENDYISSATKSGGGEGVYNGISCLSVCVSKFCLDYYLLSRSTFVIKINSTFVTKISNGMVIHHYEPEWHAE